MKENVIKFEGSLTISGAEEYYKKLKDRLDKPGDIIVDVKGADKIDLSFLQLLCSLHTSCIEKDKKMKILAEDNFWKLLEETGYLRGELLNSKEN